MAKGQQKSNREAKKPKANKKPPAASVSPFTQPSASAAPKPAKKQG